MLRGGAGSRGGAGAAAMAKPPRRPPRPPPVPSRRARAAVASPESKKGAKVLEDPVVSSLVEESSFTFEFKRGCKRTKKAMPPSEAHIGKESSREGFSNKQNMVPANKPVTKEAPKEVEFSHCTPGIVARLMGLDTVPRSKKILDRCQSDIQTTVRLQLSRGVQEVSRSSCDDRTCRSSADELPELKDVFEVTEMESMATRMALQSGNEKPRPKSNGADLEFVRQKFLDAKRLSTDEDDRNSKEFGEALEILYSKKDVFLEILQENSTMLSEFPGHILGYSGFQSSPHRSNGAGAQLFEQGNLCSTEVECASGDPLSSMHLKETSIAPLQHLTPKGSKSSGRRSQIVVLKPNIQRQSLTPVVSRQETSQNGQWTGTRSLKPPRHRAYKQDAMHSMALSNIQVLEPESDMPELKVIKPTHKRGSRRKPSREERYLEIGQREKVASTSHNEILPDFSSTSSGGSSVSRKARKHLSERWQMARQSIAETSVPTDTRTLGEMLELSDIDPAKVITHKIPIDPNISSYNVQVVQASPLGISSKDGWKTGIYCEDGSRGGPSKNFHRSKSLPASSTTAAKLPGKRRSATSPSLPILKDILNTPTDESRNVNVRKRSAIRKAKQKNGRAIFHVGKENMLHEKEIYVTSEIARHSICTSDLPLTSNIYNEYPGDAINTEDHITIDSAVPHDDMQNFKGEIMWTEQKQATSLPAVPHDDMQNFKGEIMWTEQKQATSLPEQKEDIPVHNQDNIALKEGKGRSLESDIAEVDLQTIKSADILSSESWECSSPTTSLQQSSGEDTAYSGIFKCVNDGIQELRAQLKMLKMDDQVDTCGDYPDTFSGDECSETDISNYQVKEEQLPLFKDEYDRDYTYVQDMFGSACYPEELHVSSHVFLWLENKYNKQLLWSKSDRKLIFDLVNSILADMTAPGSTLYSKIIMDCCTEMDQSKLAEYVWQTVLLVRSSYQQFDLESVPPLPLDHRSGIEVFGAEIAEMIHEDVLEEFVAQFI